MTFGVNFAEYEKLNMINWWDEYMLQFTSLLIGINNKDNVNNTWNTVSYIHGVHTLDLIAESNVSDQSALLPSPTFSIPQFSQGKCKGKRKVKMVKIKERMIS